MFLLRGQFDRAEKNNMTCYSSQSKAWQIDSEIDRSFGESVISRKALYEDIKLNQWKFHDIFTLFRYGSINTLTFFFR